MFDQRPSVVQRLFFPEERELGKGTLVIQDLCWNVRSFVPEERGGEDAWECSVRNQKRGSEPVFCPYSLSVQPHAPT